MRIHIYPERRLFARRYDTMRIYIIIINQRRCNLSVEYFAQTLRGKQDRSIICPRRRNHGPSSTGDRWP